MGFVKNPLRRKAQVGYTFLPFASGPRAGSRASEDRPYKSGPAVPYLPCFSSMHGGRLPGY